MIVPYKEAPLTKKEVLVTILVVFTCLGLCIVYYIVVVPFILELVNFLRDPWYRMVDLLLSTFPVLLFFLFIGQHHFWGTRIS